MSEGQTSKKQKPKNTLEGVIYTNVGSHIAPVYKRVADPETGKSLVKQIDTFDLFEFIQASKSQTDIALLQKRYVETGEIPSVDPTMTSADFVNYPEDIHEVYAMAQDIAGNFAKLPKSIQDIFGTKENYMKSLIDGTYQATLINAINSMKAPQHDGEKEGNE